MAGRDEISTAPVPGGNPFDTPHAQSLNHSIPQASRSQSRAPSRAESAILSRDGSAVALATGTQQPKKEKYFRSRRIKKGEVQKPWLDKKDPREKWVTIIPILGIIAGCMVAAALIWDGLRTVTNHTYCDVLYEDFSYGWNDDIWSKEVEVGGFG